MKINAFTLAVFVSLLVMVHASEAQQKIVLELFTSQGCSSCPPADDFLEELQADESSNVIALSYHVDYWNYIGWKDPFSKKEYTDKQRNYASRFRSSSIYTPQLVINGQEHFVGSNRSQIKTALKRHSNSAIDNKLELTKANASASEVAFEYQFDGDISGKSLRAILVIEKRTTEVKRGENRNRTLVNSHVVVNERTLENVQTKQGRIEIPSIVKENDKLRLILVLETNKKIINGAEIAL